MFSTRRQKSTGAETPWVIPGTEANQFANTGRDLVCERAVSVLSVLSANVGS